ncbi:glycoside hydrolase family 88 protein [Pedobacter hartonius]|uniref:Unsaturated rhamnogalacturonyl hydrolase n=1 Tax=Pedobacter hartonius TaxID=425514 RepID=A0A1H4GYW3_9SPHI|nr:glycoside hydrolase family 88 protein [Pedobacter hartonius]SEB14531.1 unsaturated rhamnogalacturonyl hydrolase [Pedobacter hartonius]
MNLSLRFTAFCLIATCAGTISGTQAQTKPLSEQMAATVMDIWKDSLSMGGHPVRWTYDQGIILEGVDAIWRRTGNADYFRYVQKSMDHFVTPEGDIRTYNQDAHNIDNIKNGSSLLTLYKVTGQQKYFKAATLLWNQLQLQPRTKEGGFWHKKVYPYQMWLDGLYMGEPFYAEYAALIRDDKAFDDIANQFIFMEKHSRDAKTGLLYHGWDESKEQKWADPQTGHSPHFWGRAMGWYAMALVDVLDNFPASHTKRKELLAILSRLATAVQKYQDPESGVWYDILNLPDRKGNYLESSASSMFVYALQKGVRKVYLPVSYAAVAKKGYAGIQKEFIEQRASSQVNLKGTVSVSGLGGKPYRDGSFEYYIREKVITNDPKGVGAFMLAANEMDLAAVAKKGLGKTVMLDYYFNSEVKKDQSGQDIQWHYKWEEMSNGGYSLWGQVFEQRGFKLKSLTAAPTAANLKNAAVYIIADPDIVKENPKPNYIGAAHITAITNWVKAGGVLVIRANDTGNVELDHLNQLTANFGITFNKDSKNRVTGSKFEMGSIIIPSSNTLFKDIKQIYVKEYSTLQLKSPARSALQDKEGNAVMAVARLGKGSVYAIGDPWLYNEYTDGRKIPGEYENFNAAGDLTDWIAGQLPVVNKK